MLIIYIDHAMYAVQVTRVTAIITMFFIKMSKLISVYNFIIIAIIIT